MLVKSMGQSWLFRSFKVVQLSLASVWNLKGFIVTCGYIISHPDVGFYNLSFSSHNDSIFSLIVKSLSFDINIDIC